MEATDVFAEFLKCEVIEIPDKLKGNIRSTGITPHILKKYYIQPKSLLGTDYQTILSDVKWYAEGGGRVVIKCETFPFEDPRTRVSRTQYLPLEEFIFMEKPMYPWKKFFSLKKPGHSDTAAPEVSECETDTVKPAENVS